MTIQTQWFEVLGYEGRYATTGDGLRLRSLPRTTKFGNSPKHISSKALKLRSDGTFQLRSANGEVKFLRPTELAQKKGREVTF